MHYIHNQANNCNISSDKYFTDTRMDKSVMANFECEVNTYINYHDTEWQKKTTFRVQQARLHLTLGCPQWKQWIFSKISAI